MNEIKFFKKNTQLITFIAITILIIISRRWMQIYTPQVWDEDSVIISSFIADGYSTLLSPVNGYLILIPKLISIISINTSLIHYPKISTAITLIFTACIILAIWKIPTSLNGKLFCALGTLLIPCDPEVFLLPLYTFWWASIFLFLLILWDEDKSQTKTKIILLTASGLSSPIVITTIPIFLLRAIRRKTYSNFAILLTAIIISGIQLNFILLQKNNSNRDLYSLVNFIPKFFGSFLLGNTSSNTSIIWWSGAILLGVIVFNYLKKPNITTTILIYLLFCSILLTAARVNISEIHQLHAGPRYFFFPFIIMSWTLIQIITKPSLTVFKPIATVALLASLINSIPGWSRSHDDLRWKNQISSCLNFPTYTIPIQYDGNSAHTWDLNLSKKQCEDIINNSLLDSIEYSSEEKIRPFSLSITKIINPQKYEGNLLQKSISGSDYHKIKIPGIDIYGTHQSSDSDTGFIQIKLNKNDRILFRSGPDSKGLRIVIDGMESNFDQSLPVSDDWKTLTFSNLNLPTQFTVTLSDNGKSFGQWFAIGLGENIK